MGKDETSIFHRFVLKHSPSRQELLDSRWLRFLGPRIRASELWRFTRRSVPRGVAVGAFIGIFLMIPGLQIIGAAFMSVPTRANIPIAAAMTFLSNPFTTPFFLGFALEIGSFFGFKTDLTSFIALSRSDGGLREWLAWSLSDAAPAMALGLFLIGSACALVGFVVSLVVWRLWIGRKWRQRLARESNIS